MNRHIVKFAFILLPLIGAACSTIDTQAVNTRIENAEFTLPVMWQSSITASSHPQSWQSLFEDKILADYLMQAERHNLSLEQAAARVRQAAAQLKQSEATLLPSISADLQATGSSFITDTGTADDSYGAGISAQWNPDIFGANAANTRQVAALFNLQKANAERLRRAVLSQTARAYMRVIEVDQQLALARENLTFIGETKRISQARFTAGDIARDNLSLSQLEFENASASVMNLELSARQARRALSLLIGGFGDEKLQVADRLPSPANLGTQGIPAHLLSARFDILASRANLASRLAGLESIAADDWPRINLSGRVGAGGNISDIFNLDRYIASLTASLAANLFDAGRNEARLSAGRASIDEALATYKQTLRTAVSEVNSAFDEVTVLRRSLGALNRASTAANKALELEKIKYDLGESILLDVLTVQRRVNSIKASKISTERRLLDAQISAYLAIGGSG